MVTPADTDTGTCEADQEKSVSLSDAKDILDTVYLVNALIQSNGNITYAAERLGLGRRTVYDLMDRLGISCTDGKIGIKLTPLLQHTEIKAPKIEEYF